MVTLDWDHSLALRKDGRTVQHDLGAILFGDLGAKKKDIGDGLKEVAGVLWNLYETHPRHNYQGTEYPADEFPEPAGRLELERIYAMKLEGSKHPPNHLRLLPRQWWNRREWNVESIGLKDERPFLFNGYVFTFSGSGGLFVGNNDSLYQQLREEVEGHHGASAMDWFKEFRDDGFRHHHL